MAACHLSTQLPFPDVHIPPVYTDLTSPLLHLGVLLMYNVYMPIAERIVFLAVDALWEPLHCYDHHHHRRYHYY